MSRIGVPVLLVLVGLAVLLYPVVATQWNNVRQQHTAQEYSKYEKKADPAVLDRSLEEARGYNETRNTGPILDPWLSRVSEDNADYQEYLRQLSNFGAMARIVVPDIHIDLPVYHGTDEDVLQRGVGHLFGSDLPVGGPGNHSILTGHTGLSTATLFDNLKDAKPGQPVYISVAGEKLKYEIDQTKVVLPEETGDLAPVKGQDLITLVTCTPYGINSHRLLVRAHRVPMDPAEEKVFDDSGFHMQWWMWVIIAAAIIILLLLAWWIRNMIKKSKQAAAVGDADEGDADDDDYADYDEYGDYEGYSDNADGHPYGYYDEGDAGGVDNNNDGYGPTDRTDGER